MLATSYRSEAKIYRSADFIWFLSLKKLDYGPKIIEYIE